MSSQHVAQSVPRAAAASDLQARALKVALAALLLALAYWLSFSHNFDDALDTARWMQNGEIQKMYEFRHLISRLIPFWLWHALGSLGLSVSALTLLQWMDLASAVFAVLLLFTLLGRLEIRPPYALGATFAFATSWAFWMYVGTGRPYSTSVLFAFAAYYVALQMSPASSERALLFAAAGAGMLVMLSCLFWLQQATNCFGVGLLVAMRPKRRSMLRRCEYLATYAGTGLLLTLAILFSGFHYTGGVRTPAELHSWIASTGTAPVKYDGLGLMKASFGQAGGILYLDGLPYMVNGLLRGDRRLLQIGSLPWQLSKYGLAWLLLLPVYFYPLLAFRRATPEKSVVLISFGAPLLLNGIFALGWLGSDVQRFLPSFGCLAVLGALAAGEWMAHLRQPGPVAVGVAAVLVFIAGVNLLEGNLREQREFKTLAREMEQARGKAGPRDFVVFFGRDLSVTYHTMMQYYIGPSYLDLDDAAFYDWDRPDWQLQLAALIQKGAAEGGRVFVVDRLALGVNPVAAAWSEVQHPRPTVKDVANFLRANFCLTPAWSVGPTTYWQLSPRTASCASSSNASPRER
jgi:hypothetical protein